MSSPMQFERADAGAAGRGVRRRQHHHPAQGGGARAGGRGLAGGAGDRRGEHAQLRRRAHPGREHGRDRARWPRCRRPSEGRRLWCWAPEDRLAPRSGRWPGRVPRSRSGTAPAAGRTSWPATSPAGPREGERPGQRRSGPRRRVRGDRQLHRDRDARRGPLRAPALDPERFGRGHHRRRPRLRGLGEPAGGRGAEPLGARRSTAWRSWSRQGAESLRIWTGMDPPLDVMRDAAGR